MGQTGCWTRPARAWLAAGTGHSPGRWAAQTGLRAYAQPSRVTEALQTFLLREAGACGDDALCVLTQGHP